MSPRSHRDDPDCPHSRHRPVSQRSEPLRLALLAPTLAPAGGLCRWSREFVRSLEAVADADTIHIDVLVRNQLDVGQATVDAYGAALDEVFAKFRSDLARAGANRHG